MNDTHIIYDLKTTYSPNYYETNELKVKDLPGILWLKRPRVLLLHMKTNNFLKSPSYFYFWNRFTEPIITEYRKKYINGII